jgi:hypothetical protein
LACGEIAPWREPAFARMSPTKNPSLSPRIKALAQPVMTVSIAYKWRFLLN